MTVHRLALLSQPRHNGPRQVRLSGARQACEQQGVARQAVAHGLVHPPLRLHARPGCPATASSLPRGRPACRPGGAAPPAPAAAPRSASAAAASAGARGSAAARPGCAGPWPPRRGRAARAVLVRGPAGGAAPAHGRRREPQGGHQQPGAVRRAEAEAGHQDPRAAGGARGAAEVVRGAQPGVPGPAPGRLGARDFFEAAARRRGRRPWPRRTASARCAAAG